MLIRWQPSDDEELHRCAYITQQVQDFLASEAARQPDRGRLSPARQLASKLDAFVAGDTWAQLGWADTPPAFLKLRPTGPAGPNLWELRTLDVRLFGWFPGPRNVWVGVTAVLKKELVHADGSADEAAYAACMSCVASWRAAHGLAGRVWRLAQDDIPLHLKL